MKTWLSLLLALWMMVPSAVFADAGPVYTVDGRIPLGIETFQLEPSGHQFYLMASVENPHFQGMYRKLNQKKRDRLFYADHKRVLFYPSHVDFRLTASTWEKLNGDPPYKTKAKIGVDDMLKQIRFRVKVFHGLQYWYIQPSYVENLGLPDSIPYNERIYRIGFDIGKVPIKDRIIMEVLSPTGERLCKFHLDIL